MPILNSLDNFTKRVACLIGLNIGIFIFFDALPMPRKLSNDELERLSPEQFRQAAKHPVTIVLDNVRSLHNVGSAFRTADAFRISEILLCGITGTPPHREIEKTALGATQTVRWQHFPTTREAIVYLRKNDFVLYAVEQAEKSVMLADFSSGSQPIALIFGNEVYGVSQEAVSASDGVIEIPQSGSKHSLNVSVSIGIVLWEVLRNKLS